MRTNAGQGRIDGVIEPLYERLIDVRRHLHMHPEPSGHELETSRFLLAQLRGAGLHANLGPEGYGVLSELVPRGGSRRPRLALRADVDALRIQDEKHVSYRSQCPGVMHACGHDVHSSIVLGTLWALKQLQDAGDLPDGAAVRGIFQPAEETCQGALRMIESGALEDVVAILATHVDPTLPAGRVGLKDGVLTATCDEMHVRVVGRGGHAARPHESHDPISAAAHLISALYLHIPRVTDSQEAVVVTIGRVAGGHNANVIPEQVELQGTIRTLSIQVREHARQHILRIAAGVAATTETRIEVDFGVGAPSVVNDPALVGLLRETAVGLFGEAGLHEIPRPSMGGEDFAFYLQQVPGAMVRLGCAGPGIRPASLHSPHFDVDEQVIRVGVRLLTRAAVDWCGRRVPPDR